MQAQRPGSILLVDGDETFLGGAAEALYSLGHRVDVCATADEALHQLETKVFDVVICAQRLADGRGERLCHFIKTNPDSGQSLVALTVDLTIEDPEATTLASYAIPTGPNVPGSVQPDDVLVKPMTAESLAGRVMALLRMRRYLEESGNAIGALMLVAQGIEEQDKRRKGHCRRLALMSLELGAVLGCDEWELTALERGGFLHDIGMATIHGALTHKEGDLSLSEMDVIKTHTLRGEELCQGVAALQPVLPIIRSHHERADGTGYPDKLRGNEIPKLARIFAIPHLYEALRSWRPYQDPASEARAVAIMREEVKWGCWDLDVFDAFVNHVLPGLNTRLDAHHALWPQG